MWQERTPSESPDMLDQRRIDQASMTWDCVPGPALDQLSCLLWWEAAGDQIQPDHRWRAILACNAVNIDPGVGLADHAMESAEARQRRLVGNSLEIGDRVPDDLTEVAVLDVEHARGFAHVQEVGHASFNKHGSPFRAGERAEPEGASDGINPTANVHRGAPRPSAA